MPIKLVLLCIAMSFILIALGGQADARNGRDQCAGILHQDGSKLWFGGAKGEGEGICIVDAAQVAKVLKTCSAGRWCRVVGTTADCKDSGECAEIKDVVSVTATKPRR
jgi:hypothetical protein